MAVGIDSYKLDPFGSTALIGLNVIPLIRWKLNTCDFARFTGVSEHSKGNSQRKHSLKHQTHRSFLTVGDSGALALEHKMGANCVFIQWVRSFLRDLAVLLDVLRKTRGDSLSRFACAPMFHVEPTIV